MPHATPAATPTTITPPMTTGAATIPTVAVAPPRTPPTEDVPIAANVAEVAAAPLNEATAVPVEAVTPVDDAIETMAGTEMASVATLIVVFRATFTKSRFGFISFPPNATDVAILRSPALLE